MTEVVHEEGAPPQLRQQAGPSGGALVGLDGHARGDDRRAGRAGPVEVQAVPGLVRDE